MTKIADDHANAICDLDKRLDRLIGYEDRKIWFNINEAAKYLTLSLKTLQNLHSNRKIYAARYGGKLWFNRKDLDAYLRQPEFREKSVGLNVKS